MRNNENGRSMVEMLGVLAIIGVLSAGGLAGYSKAMFKHKLNTTMEQVTMLVTNIRTAYGSQRGYTGLSMSQADSLGILPAGIKNVSGNTTVYRNPFKGIVDIAPVAAKKQSDAQGAPTVSAVSGFTVKYTNLPKEACIALATADFGSGAGSGFIGVDAGDSDLSQSSVYIGDVKTAADGEKAAVRGEGNAYEMAGALDACKEPSTIIWKFY